MFTNPGAYLNGTAANPAGNGAPVYNVTGCIKPCVLQLNESLFGPDRCTIVQDEVQRDAYLWWVIVLRGRCVTVFSGAKICAV